MRAGRQTGTAEWKASRGETGPVYTSSQQAPLAGASWRRARDQHLLQAHPHRLCGGAVRASGENLPTETALQVCCHAHKLLGVILIHECAAFCWLDELSCHGVTGIGVSSRYRPDSKTAHIGPIPLCRLDVERQG